LKIDGSKWIKGHLRIFWGKKRGQLANMFGDTNEKATARRTFFTFFQHPEFEDHLSTILLSSFLCWHTPLGQEVILVVVFDTAPSTMEEERNGRIQHDITIEIFMRLVKHAAIVACVNVIPAKFLTGNTSTIIPFHQTSSPLPPIIPSLGDAPPAVLGGINVKFGHAS